MGTSLYYSARRSIALTEQERLVIERRIQLADLSNPSVGSKFDQLGADTAEGFDYSFEQLPMELLSGATKLPDSRLAFAISHWLELLTEIRRAIPDATWDVRVEDEAVLWDDDVECFDLPGLADAVGTELGQQSTNVTVADKVALGRSITSDFADQGFTWNTAEHWMERASGDIRIAVWFRPLTNNDEIYLHVWSNEMMEWLSAEHDGLPETNTSRLGMLESISLAHLEYLLHREHRVRDDLTTRTIAAFRDQVVEAIQTHFMAIERMYQQSPDDLFDFYQRLGRWTPELLLYFLWRGRRDLAERHIAAAAENMSTGRRHTFHQAVTDPGSTDRPPTVAVIAHAFDLPLDP